MKLKLFTFRFDPDTFVFDDKALQEFILDKEVLDYSEHFFVHENLPHILIIISYRLSQEGLQTVKYKKYGSSIPDLDEAEKNVFNALKTWRLERAKTEGVPAYMIASNQQLTDMIRKKIRTKPGLQQVYKFGKAKIDQYGDQIIAILLSSDNPVPGEISNE